MKKGRRSLRLISWGGVFALVLGTGPSLAGEVKDDFSNLTVVEEEDLEGMRAGDFDINTTVQSIQDLQASVNDSEFNAHIIVNGSITIEEHAFDNFGGIGLVVGNTGNNNAIDAALGVTFHLH